VHLPDLPPGPPPATCDGLVAAGNHLRDHGLLLEAVRREPEGRPIELVGRSRPREGHARLRPVPELPLPALRDRLARARAVVVAVQHDPDKAAGISILALAQALGRPVVATATPATLDHVRHEVDGLLVPCGDADALAAALRRIDEDDDLVDRLAEGARAAAARASTDAWAAELLDGVAPPPRPSLRGPFPPW
jgi:glycosyltransferase involved in cell wall biosynthesis